MVVYLSYNGALERFMLYRELLSPDVSSVAGSVLVVLECCAQNHGRDCLTPIAHSNYVYNDVGHYCPGCNVVYSVYGYPLDMWGSNKYSG